MKEYKITEFTVADLAAVELPSDWVGAPTGSKRLQNRETRRSAENPDKRVRLQKALAGAGVASRRACETLITRGRVRVNGEAVWELGTKIDPQHDEVRVDGVVVQLNSALRYFVLNKPTGVVSTMRDEKGRPDLRRYTKAVQERIYNVGRLDTDTSGLLILTNDGELAHKLAHPKFGVEKTYVAKVRGAVKPATVQRLKQGIVLEDGFIRADSAKMLAAGSNKNYSLLEITLHSGRNRIVRRMLDAVGHPVIELHRKQFGPLHLGSLPVGELRELAAAERGALLTAAEGKTKGAPRRKITAGRPGDGAGAQGMRGVAKARPQIQKPLRAAGKTSTQSKGKRT